MQRYKEGTWFMQKDDDGNYVLYSDAMQEIAAQKESVKYLEDEILNPGEYIHERDGIYGVICIFTKDMWHIQSKMDYKKIQDEIEAKDKEIAELKDQYPAALKYCPAHRTIGVQIKERTPCCIIDALEAKLSRLTAALNDDERAEKVAKSTPGYWSIRGRAINGYRAMLKEAL